MNSYFKQNEKFNEMVFENRNKSYGAYAIRQAYNDSLIKGLLIACGILLSSTLLYSAFHGKPPVMKFINLIPEQDTTINVVIEDPEVKKDEPKEESKPKVQTTQGVVNAPPVITSNPVTPQTTAPLPSAPTGDPNGKDTTNNSFTPVTNTGSGGNGTAPAGPPQVYPLTDLEVMPEFTGGVKKMKEFLNNNLTYPEYAKELGTQGTVYLSFVVTEDGSITDVNVIKSVPDGCNAEASRVIKMMPKWKPGILAGKPVRTRCQIPIKFELK